jgi:CarboxypepD_reg-like domain
MKKQMLSLLLFLYTIVSHTQITTLQGKIVDETTQKGIPYANIGIPKYSIGTTSNELGDFIIKIASEHTQDTLVFSSIGYTSFKTTVSQMMNVESNKKITLKPNDIKLKEVVIKAFNGKKLIDMFLKKRFENYGTDPVMMQVFCRETMKERDTERYFTQSEGILEMYKASVKYEDDHVRMIKGRKKPLSNVHNRQAIPQIVNGPTTGIILDIVKNSRHFLLQNRQFHFVFSGYESINDHVAYVVDFTPRDSTIRVLYNTDFDFYKGKIYLDTATFAMMRADFVLSVRGVRVANILLENNESPLVLVNRTFIVNYSEFNQKWYFNSAKIENQYTHGKAKLQLTHKIENVVTQMTTQNVKKFSRKDDIQDNDSLEDSVEVFNDAFWDDYNFIKAIKN